MNDSPLYLVDDDTKPVSVVDHLSSGPVMIDYKPDRGPMVVAVTAVVAGLGVVTLGVGLILGWMI